MTEPFLFSGERSLRSEMPKRRFNYPNISLSAYTLRVRDLANLHTAAKTDNFAGGKDLFTVLMGYLEELKVNRAHDAEEQKLVGVSELSHSGRYIQGIIQTGDYGYEATLIDIDTRRLAHRRKVREAELIPFFFLIYLPKNADEGIVILQRFRNLGVRESFLSQFEKWFKTTFRADSSAFRLEINPIVDAELVNKYINDSSLKKIRMVQFKMHPDIAKAMKLQDHLEEIGSIEISVSARFDGALEALKSKVSQVLNKKSKLEGLIEFPGLEYDTVKCEVDIGGAKRTIDLAHPYEMSAYFDISHDVKIKNGHPEFDSIHAIARTYCSRIDEILKKGLQSHDKQD